jgi:hypothetical protein
MQADVDAELCEGVDDCSKDSWRNEVQEMYKVRCKSVVNGIVCDRVVCVRANAYSFVGGN